MTVYKLELIKIDRKTLIECINNKTHVIYEGTEYFPQAYILRKVKNVWIHSVELKDLKSNSILTVSMDRIGIL